MSKGFLFKLNEINIVKYHVMLQGLWLFEQEEQDDRNRRIFFWVAIFAGGALCTYVIKQRHLQVRQQNAHRLKFQLYYIEAYFYLIS